MLVKKFSILSILERNCDLENYNKNIGNIDIVIKSFNDKFNFLKGQLITLSDGESDNIPAIITKVHPEDENGNYSYDVMIFINNNLIVEDSKRYIWRFVSKQFDITNLLEFIHGLNNDQKYSNVREKLFINYGICELVIIEDNQASVISLKPSFFEDFKNSSSDKQGSKMGKTLGNTDANGATKNVKDIKFFGNGDLFQLISKASSENEGWMKSTKAMDVGVGCVVQVTTQQRNPDGSFAVAEALTFVPGVEIRLDYEESTDNSGALIGRTIVPKGGDLL